MGQGDKVHTFVRPVMVVVFGDSDGGYDGDGSGDGDGWNSSRGGIRK